MYFEEAEVKEYERKSSNKTYKQIHLGINSNFKKFDKVAIIKINDFEELKNNPKPEDVEGYLRTIEELTSEKEKLQQDLQEQENKYKNLIEEKDSKIEKANAKYDKLLEETNSKIEKANANVIEAKDKISEIQQEKENIITDKDNEIKELNSKLNTEKEDSKKLLASIVSLTNKNTELEKENIFLKSRSLFNRLINKQYVKESDVPEIVEAEAKEHDERNIKE